MGPVGGARVDGVSVGSVRSVLVEQAAQLLGVSRRTVYYRIRDGQLLTFRTRCGSRRVFIESVERLLREKEKLAGDRGAVRDSSVAVEHEPQTSSADRG